MPCPYCGRDKCPGDGVYLFESEVIEALRSCRNAMLQGAEARAPHSNLVTWEKLDQQADAELDRAPF